MTTWNGKDENLVFRCKSCNFESEVEIDLDDKEDKETLWAWLQIHSENGGDYINKKIDKEFCALCSEEIKDSKGVVTYTGHPVCDHCGKSITKIMMEKMDSLLK